MATPPNKSLLAEVGTALSRHILAATLAALVVFLAVLAFTAYSPRWYRSEAKLFVRLGRESVTLDPTATTTGQVLPVQGTRDNEINSVYHLLLSRDLAATIVDRLGPSRILNAPAGGVDPTDSEVGWVDRINPLHVYSPRDLAIQKFSKLLDVAVEKNSSVITIQYDAKDPALAQQVVKLLVEGAREMHIKIHAAQGSEGFFAEQAATLRERVALTERKLRDLRNESSVPDVRMQREIQVQRIGKLQEQELAMQARVTASEAELAAHRASVAAMPEVIQTSETTGLPNTAAAGMRQQLFSLQLEEMELLAKNQEESIQLQNIRDQVKFAKDELAAHKQAPQVTQGINQARLDLRALATRGEAELAALKAQSQIVAAQVASERDALAKLNDYELKLNEVERRLELEVASHRQYAEKLEQSRIDLALQREQISNLNLMQEPTFSITPISPHVALNLVIGTLLGLMASVAAAVSLEMLSASAVRRVPVSSPAMTGPLTLTPGAARA